MLQFVMLCPEVIIYSYHAILTLLSDLFQLFSVVDL